MSTYPSTPTPRFMLGDNVVIDPKSRSDTDAVRGIVTGISIRFGGAQAEVSWWHNGEARAGWFDEPRLMLVPPVPVKPGDEIPF